MIFWVLSARAWLRVIHVVSIEKKEIVPIFEHIYNELNTCSVI